MVTFLKKINDGEGGGTEKLRIKLDILIISQNVCFHRVLSSVNRLLPSSVGYDCGYVLRDKLLLVVCENQ